MGGTLGLIAGSGRLPFEVAEAARDAGSTLVIAAIEQNTDPAIEAYASGEFTWVAAGELDKLIGFLKAAGVQEVILAGAVAKREMFHDVASLRPDARALALLQRLGDTGDDAILRAVAAELESEGLQVVESTAHLGDRLTSQGRLAGPEPDARIASDLALGLRVARHVGELDIGQSVVVRDGSVLAVEAIEGTDQVLSRGAELGGAGTVLVKAAKPRQDLRFDVPVIGLATLELAAEHQLAAIGLEVGRTLVLERERAFELAERAGIALVGLVAGDA
jgi:hypothetical protein